MGAGSQGAGEQGGGRIMTTTVVGTGRVVKMMMTAGEGGSREQGDRELGSRRGEGSGETGSRGDG